MGRRCLGLSVFVVMVGVLVGGVPAVVVVPEVAVAAEDPPAEAGREIVERRTAASRTVDNGDGSLTTTVFNAPIHYRGSDGSFVAIDNTLVERRGGRWRNRANRFLAEFAADSAGEMLSFSVAGERFGFSLEGAGRRPVGVDGPRASYEQVLPGVDVEYEVLASGVKETLLLADRSVPRRYQYRLNVPGDLLLDAREQPDGSWAFFRPQDDVPFFVLERPYAVDASQDREQATLAGSNATMAVRERTDGFVVTVTVDRDWFASDARRFPVELDPTITIQPPGQDANWAMNCNCSAWLNEKLYVGTSDDQVWRPTVQFDLSAVPSGVQVTDAQLKTYMNGWFVSVSGTSGWQRSHDIDVHRMTAPWDVNADSTDDLQFDSTVEDTFHLPADSPDQWMAWDVTSPVLGWLDGTVPNYGLLLKRSDETLGMSGPTVPGMRYTADTSVRPRLEVTYVSDAVTLQQPDTVHLLECQG